MAQPGWFPDPGGQPGMFRYWDGTAWTQELSAGPPGRGPSRPGKPGRGSGPIVAGFAALVVLVLLAIVVLPRMFGDGSNPTETRAAPRSPTVSAWDETTRPTPTPTPTPTKSPEVSLPCPKYDEAVVNGRLYGGGLSVPMINDSRWSVNPVRSIPWAVCATGLERRIAADWVSEVILAGVQPRSVTGSLQEQADAIAADARQRFYQGGPTRFKPISSRGFTLGVLKAWELRIQIRIDYLKNISGDNVNVVVVQHVDGSRSVLMTFATIGDAETQRQVDACRNGIKIEKR